MFDHFLCCAWLAPLMISTVFSKDQTEERAQAIIAKAVQAHGGQDNLSKLRIAKISYTSKGTLPIKGFEEMDIRVEETLDIPRRMKKVISGSLSGKEISISWAVEDGKEKYWSVANGELSWQKGKKADVKTMQRTYYSLEEMAASERAPWTVIDEGKDGMPIGVSTEGSPWALFFDRKTGLLIRMTNDKFMPRGSSKEIKLEHRLSGYKEAQGVKLFTRQVGYANGKKIFEMIVTDIKLFKKLGDEEFTPPQQ